MVLTASGLRPAAATPHPPTHPPQPFWQATGLQAKWERVKGLPACLGDGRVVSNMNVGTAPLTFKAVQALREGHAVFTMPKGVIKCPGAGQKVWQPS